jgi:UDP-GlcNAc:undecaprenyl-phosphate GlcNAc-1-phosphate transferase
VLSLLIPVAVLAVPIFDTTLVSATRVLHGRSVSQGGRDHSSHRLVALGLSERGAVLLFYGITALFGGLAIAATRLSLLVTLLLATVCFVGLAVVGLYLGFIKVYHEQSEIPPNAPLIGGRLLYKKQSLQVVVDIVLIHVAFVGAQLLRFEGELPPDMQRALLAALPTVVVAKLLALAACRAYRGVWRYAGMADGLTAVAGCTLGSLLAAAVLGVSTGFVGLSRTALIIDWLLFTLLALSVRTGFSALRELFSMLPPREGPRVLILGAGTEALALMQRLRDPFAPRRAHVLGILDDAPHHHRRTLNGVSVLGPISDLPAAFRDRGVSCCLLGVSPRSEEGERILAFCRDHAIPVYGDPEAGPILSSSLSIVVPLDLPRRSARAGGPGSI